MVTHGLFMKLSPPPSPSLCGGWLVGSGARVLSEIFKCLRAFHTRLVASLRGRRPREGEQQRSHSSSAGVCSDTDASGNVRLNHSDQNSQQLRENSGFVSRLGMLGDAMFHLPGQNLNPVRSLDNPGPSSEAADVPTSRCGSG